MSSDKMDEKQMPPYAEEIINRDDDNTQRISGKMIPLSEGRIGLGEEVVYENNG